METPLQDLFTRLFRYGAFMVSFRYQKGSVYMPNFNLKGIPSKLFVRLKRSARVNRRSMTGEIIYRLEESMGMLQQPVRRKRKTK
jgi:hypothetical protein